MILALITWALALITWAGALIYNGYKSDKKDYQDY